MKRAASRLLRKSGVFPTVFDFYVTARGLNLDAIRAHRQAHRRTTREDLPLPPLSLVTAAAGTPDLRWFLESGKAAASGIGDTLSRNGTSLARLGTILDFGCGCGRVVRHLPPLSAASVHGADINRRAIRWCRKRLPFARFEISDLEPPLPFLDGAFDLVYSLSVFTHLPERLQHAWAQELLRLVTHGGLLLASLHGPSYLPQMSRQEREIFRSGKLVVRNADAPGSNRCASYHPPGYAVGALFDEFELLELAPEGAVGNPHQDLYLFRKPSRKDACVQALGVGGDHRR